MADVASCLTSKMITPLHNAEVSFLLRPSGGRLACEREAESHQDARETGYGRDEYYLPRGEGVDLSHDV